MRHSTNLMDKIFSDSTPEDFKSSVSDKIEEAKAKGSAELKDEENHLQFTEKDGDVVIEDKNNDGEKTVAKDAGEEIKLVPDTKVQSATQPDVVVPVPEDEHKAKLVPDSTVSDVKVSIEEAIEDKDKAGKDKHYSIVISGFNSVEDAQMAYSELFETENINFSDTELENIAFSATELNNNYERLLGTQDAQLAFSVYEQANELRAYSELAAARGFDMSDVYEAACMYSEYADELLDAYFSNLDINEFFSEMSEDEINAYFSNLNEVEAEVLYSALMDEDENFTFSEVDEIVNEVYSDLELSQSVQEVFSEMSEDEINAIFSELSEQEANVIFSAIEDETVTFSDVNEAFDLLNSSLTEMFSDIDEDGVREFSEAYGEEVANIAYSLATEDENFTFSDALDVYDELHTFSDKDAETLSNNIESLEKADKDVQETKDVELAKKVKVLADKTAEDCEKAEEAGYDAEKAKELCAKFSEDASKVLDEAGVKPEEINKEEIMKSIEGEAKKEEKPAEEPKKEEKPVEEPKKEEKPAEEPKKEEKPVEEPKKDEPKEAPKSYSTYLGVKSKTFSRGTTEDGEQKVFGKVEPSTSCNPFLTSKIN